MRTLNNESIEDTIKKLSCIPSANSFVSAKKQLENIIGFSHYNLSYDELKFEKVGSIEFATIKCTITILDDNYSPIKSNEAYSSNVIDYKSESANEKIPVNLTSAIKRAEENAFLNCVQKFIDVKKNSSEIKKHQKKSDRQSIKNTFALKLKGKLELMPNYSNCYKADCELESGDTGQVVCWYQFVKSMKEKGRWDNIINLSPNKEITVVAKKGTYQGKIQLELLDIIQGGV